MYILDLLLILGESIHSFTTEYVSGRFSGLLFDGLKKISFVPSIQVIFIRNGCWILLHTFLAFFEIIIFYYYAWFLNLGIDSPERAPKGAVY